MPCSGGRSGTQRSSLRARPDWSGGRYFSPKGRPSWGRSPSRRRVLSDPVEKRPLAAGIAGPAPAACLGARRSSPPQRSARSRKDPVPYLASPAALERDGVRQHSQLLDAEAPLIEDPNACKRAAWWFTLLPGLMGNSLASRAVPQQRRGSAFQHVVNATRFLFEDYLRERDDEPSP